MIQTSEDHHHYTHAPAPLKQLHCKDVTSKQLALSPLLLLLPTLPDILVSKGHYRIPPPAKPPKHDGAVCTYLSQTTPFLRRDQLFVFPPALVLSLPSCGEDPQYSIHPLTLTAIS